MGHKLTLARIKCSTLKKVVGRRPVSNMSASICVLNCQIGNYFCILIIRVITVIMVIMVMIKFIKFIKLMIKI
jgi:hypothetical protein